MINKEQYFALKKIMKMTLFIEGISKFGCHFIKTEFFCFYFQFGFKQEVNIYNNVILI